MGIDGSAMIFPEVLALVRSPILIESDWAGNLVGSHTVVVGVSQVVVGNSLVVSDVANWSWGSWGWLIFPDYFVGCTTVSPLR